MNTITQTPEPIGPIPRCIKVVDGGVGIWIAFVAFLGLIAARRIFCRK